MSQPLTTLEALHEGAVIAMSAPATWNWLYSGGVFRGMCAECGALDSMAGSLADDSFRARLQQREALHVCREGQFDMRLYERHFGFEQLKKVVLPEELL